MDRPNPQQIKKDREVAHALELIRRLGIVPVPRVESGERPDIWMEVGKSVVGVEVTQFFFPLGDPAVKDHLPSLQNQAVHHAWQRFRQCGGLPLYAMFEFTEDKERCGPLDTKKMRDLAGRLCELVRSIGVPADLEYGVDSELSSVPELDRCWVDPSLDGVSECWGTPRATMGRNVSSRQVQGCLNSKRDRYRDYASNLSEVWLLIVNDWPLQAAASRIGEEARSAIYSFPFERVFWLDVDGDLVELQTQ